MINKKYKVLKFLGKGRSSVFLVEDNNGIKFALKALPSRLSDLEEKLFEKEYATLSLLEHPGIIAVYEKGIVFENGQKEFELPVGSKYILMEYFEGITLQEYCDGTDENDIEQIAIKICLILFYLHQSNYIYYDLKPENILIRKEKDSISVKLIDFGLASKADGKICKNPKGTTEFIAPELLQKHKHDHRVDLYSLGIILYKILYKTFPFSSTDPLSIYKEKVDSEIDLSLKLNFSNHLFQTLKKLVYKNPENRYENALQVVFDLNERISDNEFTGFSPAKTFSGRKDELDALNNYLNNNENHASFVISGAQGAGKTELLLNADFSDQRTIHFKGKEKVNLEIIISKIIWSEVFQNLPTEAITKITNLLSDELELEKVKTIFHILSQYSNFVLILEDFNSSNEIVKELFLKVIPLLQVNCIKTIITEEIDKETFTNTLYHKTTLGLHPFSAKEVKEYLNEAYHPSFPKEKIEELILQYSDLLPGNIISFIKQLHKHKIISYSKAGPQINIEEDKLKILTGTPGEIFGTRIKHLVKEEVCFVQMLSALTSPASPLAVFNACGIRSIKLSELVKKLELLDLIEFEHAAGTVKLTSRPLKDFIYNSIDNKKAIHNNILKYIFQKESDTDRYEQAFHYEKTGNIDKVFLLLKEEYKEAGKISGFLYKKQLLEKLITLPIKKKQTEEVIYELADTLYKMGLFNDCIAHIENAVITDNNYISRLGMIKGLCYIKKGEIGTGRELLSNVLNYLDETNIDIVNLEIASADIDLNNFGMAENVCNNYLDDRYGKELAGKAYNLLGLIRIKRNNDFDGALTYFHISEEKYLDSGNPLRIANIQSNIGNVYSIKGNISEAVKYWNKSLKTNSTTGNLHHEANLLLNYGILEKDLLNHEQSVKLYERAKNIFTSLGDLEGIGLSEINLGEIYYFTCSYKTALTLLEDAIEIFKQLNYPLEILESLMIKGKISYITGDKKTLQNVIRDFSSSLNSDTPFKYVNNYNFLRCLANEDEFYPQRKSEEYDSVVKKYLSLDDKNSYTEAAIKSIIYKIDNNLINEAYESLKEPEFVKLSRNNNFTKAAREYLYGLLAEKNRFAELGFSINYFLNAYELIKDLSINELTNAITFKLAANYFERGNRLKAKEFAVYTLKLIDYITSNIEEDDTKEAYINIKHRRSAIETCSKINEM